MPTENAVSVQPSTTAATSGIAAVTSGLAADTPGIATTGTRKESGRSKDGGMDTSTSTE